MMGEDVEFAADRLQDHCNPFALRLSFSISPAVSTTDHVFLL
ncbi:unnamed protein product [Brugia timori]|uniref:Uncharacterized protein n=1 Tax=Brugia timori TaxID=42155 RepID=A0A0R3QKY1_9BILA|nr:unnamed protein product [Brugia timori]